MSESEKRFPLNAQDYVLYEEVGEGVSATVYRALCVPVDEIVAIKVLDLEKCNNDLDGIRREVQTMTLINHPNLLRAHCSFTSGHNLWVVMPYMAGGSCLHIMKSAFPEGLEEPVIATLLHEVLKSLVYLHDHGHIHRDVKAGNILVDSSGAVKLADFGVSACMFDTGDRQRSRNTFVGTPCWMAPEVMQQLHGYDFKADIWSFGITALELAHGHAPFSKYPPMKVLLMTLQNAPPGLDYERDRRFSKSFKELVAACLVKDPKKRPSSEKLLKHHFFKHARSVDYLSRTILEGLSPLGDRFRTIKAKEADFLVQNKALYGDKEQLSQQGYIRGISSWNFNLEDLKNQAALIQDYDISNIEESSVSGKLSDRHDEDGFPAENPSPEIVDQAEAAPHFQDVLDDNNNMEDSLAAFPIKSLQALKGCFDVCDDDEATASPTLKVFLQPDTEQQPRIQSPRKDEGQEAGRSDIENLGEGISQSRQVSCLQRNFLSGSLAQDYAPSPEKGLNDADRDHLQRRYQPQRNFSGPLQYHLKKDTFNCASVEDAPEGAVIQQGGRFKLTSADLSPEDISNAPLNASNWGYGGSVSPSSPSIAAASFLPSLQYIFQQNIMQKEEISKLIKCVEQLSVSTTESGKGGNNDPSQIPTAYGERELQSQLIQLQQSVGRLVEELQRQKMKNVQLEKKLNS
ncbi:serine/threonine-protein kinase BLUS1 [Heracleum sosnowskyi]|uniref:Serine/threonine-protein kinase BLUS1 n=1 Tax=Heracleum sosnowskyi TaxID=360622 RepID=A0AAD8JIR0_9APIA|nr:serine/threonine-protein kinase BLUS1 [Heracleum sosnowskyi]